MPTVLLTTPGAGTWTVPQGITSLRVELVGGGGAGGQATTNPGGTGQNGIDTVLGSLTAPGGDGGRNWHQTDNIQGDGGTAPSGGVDGEDGSAGTGGRSGARDVAGLSGYGDGGDGEVSTALNRRAGAGGGGAYALQDNLAVTPGASLSYTVGAGGSVQGVGATPGGNDDAKNGSNGAIRLTYTALSTEVTLLTTAGAGTYVVPNDVTSLRVELVGAGGSGGPAAWFTGSGENFGGNGVDGIDTVFDGLRAGGGTAGGPGLAGSGGVDNPPARVPAFGAGGPGGTGSTPGEAGSATTQAANSPGADGGRSGSRNVAGLSSYGDGGDGGDGSNTGRGGGGGGGGGYRLVSSHAVTAGESISYVVGAGGDWDPSGTGAPASAQPGAGGNGAIRITYTTGTSPPPTSSTHTFTVTAGTTSGLTGYWDGNTGSITNGVYRLPNGSNATIRQCLIGGAIGTDELRFLLNQSGLGTSDTDQFPDRITATRGSFVAEWRPSSPEQIGAFGQGIGRDYTIVSGGSSNSQMLSNGADTEFTLHYDSVTPPTTSAPNFADDTGDAVTWTSGEAITPIVVPAATGNPTPTYSVVGTLPTGIAFDAATRTLSGTPSGTPSGTITVRATNTQGNDDWTIAYSTNPAPPPGIFSETIGDLGTGSRLRWNPATGFLIPPALIVGGATAYLLDFDGNTYGGGGRDHADINLGVSSINSGSSFAAGPELTPKWEGYEEAITVEAGGRKITIPGPNHTSNTSRDTTEPYFWNLGEAKATEWKNFVNFYRGLSQDARNATRFELRDSPLALRVSSRLDLVGLGTSNLTVLQPTPIRVVSRLALQGLGTSRLTVDQPSVRVSSRLNLRGLGTSQLTVAQPGEVRVSSRLNLVGLGTSELRVTQPSVRVSSRLNLVGLGTSQLSVSELQVRLASRLALRGLGTSRLSVAQPGGVRLTSRLNLRGLGTSRLTVDQSASIVNLRPSSPIQLPNQWFTSGGGYLRQIRFDRFGAITLYLSANPTDTNFLSTGPTLHPDTQDDIILSLLLQDGTEFFETTGITGTRSPYSWSPSEAATLFSRYEAQGRPSLSIELDLPATTGESSYVFVSPRPASEISSVYDTIAEEGAMVGIGIRDKETLPALVSSIRPSDDLSAKIRLLPLGNEIHGAETGPIPEYDPRITGLTEIGNLVVTPVIRPRELLNFTYDPETGEVTLTYSDGTIDTFILAIDGVTIESITTLPNGDIQITFSDGTILTIPRGQTGRGIMSVVRDPNTGIVTVTYDDGTVQTFLISDGMDGPGFEIVFIRTSSAIAPSRISTTPAQRRQNQFRPTSPAGVTLDPVGPSAFLPVEWAAVRTGTSGNWSEFSAWALFSRYGIDGSGIEYVYRRTSTEDRPTRITTTTSQDRINDFIPSGTTDEPVGPTSSIRYEWIAVRKGTNQNWGKFSQWTLFSHYGQDGPGFEYVFRRTATSSKPARITTTAQQDATDDFVPSGTTDDPVGKTNALPYEWIAVRRGTAGNWGKFSDWTQYSPEDPITISGGGEALFFRVGTDPVPTQVFTMQWIRRTTVIASVTLTLSLNSDNEIIGFFSSRSSGVTTSSNPSSAASPRRFTGTYEGIPIIINAKFVSEIVDPDTLELDRPKGFFPVPISQAQAAVLRDTIGEGALTQAFITLADNATPGDNVNGDFVSFYHGNFAQARTWRESTSTWVYAEPFIAAVSANFVDISAITGDFNDLTVTGILEATYLSANVFNVDGFTLSVSPFQQSYVGQTISGQDPRGVDFNLNNYDYFLANLTDSSRARGILLPYSNSISNPGEAYYQQEEGTSREDSIFIQAYVSSPTTLQLRHTPGVRLRPRGDNNIYLRRLIGIKAPGTILPLPDASGNIAPTANAGGDRTVTVNTPVSITGSGTDSDGTIASYSWSYVSGPSVSLTNANTRTVSFTPTSTGSLILRFTVIDNDGAVGHDFITITITAAAAPNIQVESSSLTVQEGNTVAIRARLTSRPSGNVFISASESDADISISPSIRTFTTSNWSIYQTFIVTAIADADTSQDSAIVTLSASGSGTSDTASVLITITDTAAPLSLPDPPNLSLTVGSAHSSTLPAATGGSGSYTYSVTGIDSRTGLSFTSSTRRLSGTPTGTVTDTITYRVSDGTNSVSQTFVVTVTAASTPLSLPDPPNLSLTVGVAHSSILPAASGGTGSYTYSVTSVQTNTGLSFTPSTRRLAGTPTGTVTSDSIFYTVNDGVNTVTQTFTVTVAAAPPPPTATFDYSWSSAGSEVGSGIWVFSANRPSIAAQFMEDGVISRVDVVIYDSTYIVSSRRGSAGMTTTPSSDFISSVESGLNLLITYSSYSVTIPFSDTTEPYLSSASSALRTLIDAYDAAGGSGTISFRLRS